jgi:hypothetical protein
MPVIGGSQPSRRVIGLNSRWFLIGEGQQRVALGAGEMTTALFAGEKHHEGAGEQQAEEYGEWNDRHGVEMSA